MLLSGLLTAIEAAFNQYLTLDEQAPARLHALQGNIIEVHITGLDIHLFFVPLDGNIKVSHEYDTDADVIIRGSALALARMAASQDAGKIMLETGIQIEGKMSLAEQFSQVLRDIDIDWEEHLSHAVGDIVAHHMGQIARESKGWLDDTGQAMRMNTTEYLQEEVQLTPHELEVNHYLDQVDQLNLDSARLEARLQRLQDKAKS